MTAAFKYLKGCPGEERFFSFLFVGPEGRNWDQLGYYTNTDFGST